MNKACKNNLHLLLSITSIKDGKIYDKACTFSGGEHEFVVKPSYVYYRDPQQRQTAFIAKCVAEGAYIAKADLDPAHFRSICDGISKSDFIRPWALKYCEENGII